MVTAAMKFKDACSLEEKLKPRQHIKKQRHYFANEGPYCQTYGFSSSHVQICELDHEEGWEWKDWCFQIAVWEKPFESPLGSKEIKAINPEGNQPWIFIGRADADAEAPIIWLPDAKSWLIGKDLETGKDWGQQERGAIEDDIVQYQKNKHHN